MPGGCPSGVCVTRYMPPPSPARALPGPPAREVSAPHILSVCLDGPGHWPGPGAARPCHVCGFLTCFWKRCCLLNGRPFWLTVSEFVFCELYQLGRGLGAAGAGEEAAAGWAGSGQAGGWAQGPAGRAHPVVSEPTAAFQGPRSSLEVQGLGSSWGDSGRGCPCCVQVCVGV